MKNHHNKDEQRSTVIPAVIVLVGVNCFVWALVLRSLLLLVAGFIILVAVYLK